MRDRSRGQAVQNEEFKACCEIAVALLTIALLTEHRALAQEPWGDAWP